MTAHERDPSDALALSAALAAGTQLRAAREAEGLTLDAVAQQLKLAPRQVKAIEDGEFALLPGRTFVRGFVRNYARLVRLDAEGLLASLPGGASDAGLAAPTLHPTAHSIGELPASQRARLGWTRWAIPLTLIGLIAAGAAYELLRPGAATRPNGPAPAAPRAPAVEPPKPAAESAPGAGTVTALPNPVAAAATEAPPPAAADAAAPVAATPASAAAGPGVATGAVTAPSAPPAPLRELVLAYRDHSWTEIRDRNGRVLLSTMMTPGARQALSGEAPFELVIGNANDVTVTLDGVKIDLAPHTRQSVARLTLQ